MAEAPSTRRESPLRRRRGGAPRGGRRKTLSRARPTRRRERHDPAERRLRCSGLSSWPAGALPTSSELPLTPRSGGRPTSVSGPPPPSAKCGTLSTLPQVSATVPWIRHRRRGDPHAVELSPLFRNFHPPRYSVGPGENGRAIRPPGPGDRPYPWSVIGARSPLTSLVAIRTLARSPRTHP